MARCHPQSQNRLMEVFIRVVTTSSASCPLHNNWKVWVCRCDVDDLADAFNGSRFERYMLNTCDPQRIYYLSSLFGGRNAGCDTKTFNGQTLLLHFLPERKLEAKLARVDIQRIQRDTDAGRDLLLNFGNFGAESCSVIVSTTREFDMITCVENGADKSAFHCCRGHTSHHNRWFA